MRRDLLKRLDALEELANRRTFPPLTLVDLTKLPDADRDAYWDGNSDVLNRYAAPVADLPPGTVTTIVISLNPESRDVWEQPRHMSDEEYERYDEARIRESDDVPPTPLVQQNPEPRFDKYGYLISN